MLAFLLHCVPSSSRYTVEQTATMATLRIFPIAQGTDFITIAITAVPTISPQTRIQTILQSSPLERLGPLGTVSLRTGMTQLIYQHRDEGASRDPCCTPPCSHQLRVSVADTYTTTQHQCHHPYHSHNQQAVFSEIKSLNWITHTPNYMAAFGLSDALILLESCIFRVADLYVV